MKLVCGQPGRRCSRQVRFVSHVALPELVPVPPKPFWREGGVGDLRKGEVQERTRQQWKSSRDISGCLRGIQPRSAPASQTTRERRWRRFSVSDAPSLGGTPPKRVTNAQIFPSFHLLGEGRGRSFPRETLAVQWLMVPDDFLQRRRRMARMMMRMRRRRSCPPTPSLRMT